MFGRGPMEPAKKEKLDQSFEVLNNFLDGQKWAAGPNMTIADLTLAASISTCDALGYPIEKYPNVQSWYTRIQKEAPGYEVNASGTEAFKQLYITLTSKK